MCSKLSYPLLSELIDLYNQGGIDLPDDRVFAYHLSRRRQEMGSAYAMLTTGKEFKQLVEMHNRITEGGDDSIAAMIWGTKE